MKNRAYIVVGLTYLIVSLLGGCKRSTEQAKESAAQSNLVRLAIDEKVTCYNLERRIRAGADEKQLSKAAIDVFIHADNWSAPARIYEMEVVGENRTVPVLRIMFPNLNGSMGMSIQGFNMDIWAGDTAEASASRKAERQIVEESFTWDVLQYRASYGGLDVEGKRKLEMAQRNAVPFGTYNREPVKLYKIGTPFPHITDINIDKQTLRIVTVQAGLLWDLQNNGRYKSDNSFLGRGRSGDIQGITEKYVLFFDTQNQAMVGYASRCLDEDYSGPLAAQAREALRRYPQLLQQARTMATQP